MTANRLRILLLTILLGVAAGGAVAALVPEHSEPRRAAIEPLPGPVRVAAPHAVLAGEGTFRLDPGSLRTELRRPDPAGGPDWAIRVYTGTRLIPDEFRRPGTSGIAGRPQCAQLGRIVGGRFGWIDATNTFRPASFARSTIPTLCGSRTPDRRRMPEAEVRTLITDHRDTSPEPRMSVAWGVAGARVDGVDVRVGPRVERPERSARGAFLVFAGPDVRQTDIRVRVRYPGGRERVAFPASMGGGLRSLLLRRRPAPRMDTVAIAARVPDPGGGPSWGLAVARDTDGGWCFGHAEQVVGDRTGQIDTRTGSFWDSTVQRLTISCTPRRYGPSRERPFVHGRSGGIGVYDRQADRGRTLLRTLKGRTALYGIAHPDVELITITTPRDIRTIVPSRRGHAFLAVYDGDFPSGRIVLTARFRDGTTKRVSEAAGIP